MSYTDEVISEQLLLHYKATQEEVWVGSYDFPNYQVSNKGRIRNANTLKVLKLREDGKEYKLASIFYNKKKYTIRVGRAVWQGFHKARCMETIDHIDRDRANDNLSNLRCITQLEQYSNKSNYERKNKYALTNCDRKLIQQKFDAGEWTTWDIMKKYGIPLNYVQTTMKRGSWKKYLNNEL